MFLVAVKILILFARLFVLSIAVAANARLYLYRSPCGIAFTSVFPFPADTNNRIVSPANNDARLRLTSSTRERNYACWPFVNGIFTRHTHRASELASKTERETRAYRFVLNFTSVTVSIEPACRGSTITAFWIPMTRVRVTPSGHILFSHPPSGYFRRENLIGYGRAIQSLAFNPAGSPGRKRQYDARI